MSHKVPQVALASMTYLLNYQPCFVYDRGWVSALKNAISHNRDQTDFPFFSAIDLASFDGGGHYFLFPGKPADGLGGESRT